MGSALVLFIFLSPPPPVYVCVYMNMCACGHTFVRMHMYLCYECGSPRLMLLMALLPYSMRQDLSFRPGACDKARLVSKLFCQFAVGNPLLSEDQGHSYMAVAPGGLTGM